MGKGRLLCRNLAIGLALACAGRAYSTTPPKPLFTIFYLKRNDREVSGHLVSYTRRRLVVKLLNGKRKHLRWRQLTPSSAFTLRARLINKKSARAWLGLGKFGVRHGVKRRGRAALDRAAALDPSLRKTIRRLIAGGRASGGGSGVGGGGSGGGSDGGGSRSGGRRHHRVPHGPLYRPATASETRRILQNARKIEATMRARPNRYKLREYKTKHFLIISDWTPGEVKGLEKTLESMYTVMRRTLAIPRHAPVFPGRLPAFMFSTFNESQLFHRLAFKATNGIAKRKRGGWGFIFATHPVTNYVYDANQFAMSISVRLTRAFFWRYRSGRLMPQWITTGLGTMLADHIRGYVWNNAPAALQVLQSPPIQGIFIRHSRPGNYDAICETVVGLMITTRPAHFRLMLQEIKAGTSPRAALRREYHCGYGGLERAWRIYLRKIVVAAGY